MTNFSGNILIVDDLPENLRVLAKMLTEKGYKVRKAINGESALLAANSTPPDLILLDIKMPEMDGYEVCERLKAKATTKEIPIIFISALSELIDKVKAFKVGGIDYIVKPFQEEEVIARIESQLTIQRQKKLLKEEIKQRKEAQEILYQSRSLISSVLNSSLDGIAALEAVREPRTGKIGDFRCVVVNPVIAEALGRQADDLVGKLFVKRLMNKLDKTLFNKLVQVVETGQPIAEDLFYQTNNKRYWYQYIAVKLGDGFSIIMRDITHRKEMEFALQKTNEELEAFSYSVSHDLRNYITSIAGYSQLLQLEQGDQLDEQGKSYIEFIYQSSLKMTQVIYSLLKLAQVKHHQMSIEQVNLSSLCQDILNNLQKQQPERKVELVIAPNIIVKGDPELLSVALENLINNAWKYTGKQEKPRIEFGVVQKQSNLIYFVRDNGVGFEMEKATKIFTPFQRLHNKKEFEGTGIGLSTVQRIIQRHGGKIWCDAKINQGATFYFTL